MRVLVTGASGMIGRAVVLALLARGDEVTAVQRRPAGLPCREITGDLGAPGVAEVAVAGQDAVVHLAAKVDVVGPWQEYAHANIDATRMLLDACRTGGVRRLVNVSSPSVAHSGTPLIGAPASPAAPDTARSNYSRSKAVAERLALAADGPDLAVIVIRPHLVWGPGDTQLVAPILARARSGRLPVVGSGAALIDTTYLDNAVDCLVAALDRCQSAHGESLVVSNGEPRPVGEILRSICEAGGVPAPRRHVPLRVAAAAGAVVEKAWRVARRPGQPPMTRFLAEQLGTAHWFDQRHTRRVLDWSPRVSLDEGFLLLGKSLSG